MGPASGVARPCVDPPAWADRPPVETLLTGSRQAGEPKNDLPEAVFCFNDPTAIGTLKAIKEAGLKCPEDIALVGFSETEVAQLIEPPLTSVLQPTYEMGETSARLLLEQINLTPTPKPETVCLIAKLNVRKSSINAHKK